MWQRIQTLYLLISTLLIGLLFFNDLAVTIDAQGNTVEHYKFFKYIPYLVLLIVIALLNLLSLTTYKFLVFQYRTIVLAAIITLALQGWIAVDWFATHDVRVFKISAIFPLVAVILDVLAARGVLADQMIVESASHLRRAKREKK